MAQTAKSINISKFEAGDRPTDQDFSNLFDSVLFLNNVGQHANGLSTANTSIEGNFKIEGDLEIGGTSVLELGNSLGIGNTTENVTSTLHVYSDHASNPVVFVSGSDTNIMFSGVSGDATSSIKLTDPQDFVEFGTHTGKAFISVAGSEYFNITGSNLGPHSFFSGSVGIGSVANANATERLRIFDANENVSAHLQTSKADGIASIGFQNDVQTYTFGVRGNDNLTVVNGSETPFKIKSNATTDNLVLDGGRVGIGVSSPTYPLHIEAYNDSAAFFKSTDNGPTYIRIDTSTADADTHSAVLYMENGTPMGASGYNAANDTINLVYATGINSDSGINIDSSGKVGIGTSAPATTLDVRGDISIGATPTITLYDNNNTSAGPDILFASDALLAAEGNFNINIDSDGNTNPNKFSVRVDGDTNAASELFYVSSSGQVSASGGFIGDGSGLTNITSGQIALFGGDLTANNLTTINNAGTGLDGEANLTFNGTDLTMGAGKIIFPLVNNTSPTTTLPNTNTLHTALFFDMDGDDSRLEYGHLTAGETFTQFRLSDNNSGDVFRIYFDDYQGDAHDKIPLEVYGDKLILGKNGQTVGIGEPSPTHLLSINTETELGGTIGDETNLLSLQFETANHTNLLFTGLRTKAGSDWQTVGTRIQSKVDSTFQGYIQFNGQNENGDYTNNYGISFGGGNNANSAEDSLEFMRIKENGNVGIGTSNPGDKLYVVGDIAVRDTGDTANVIKFQNDNDVDTKADILFNASGLITSQASLIMAINSTAGTGTFDIRTGDPQSGGEGITSTSLIASFGTGSIGSGLVIPGNSDSIPQILFDTNSDFDSSTILSDSARIKFSTTDSEGNYYVSNTGDYLVFEKLDSDQVNPDGGILFTNNGGTAGSSPETVSMAIRGSGKIGIGHIGPETRLHLKSPDQKISLFESTTDDQQAYITINSSNAGTNTHSYLYFNEGGSGRGAVGYHAGGDDIRMVYANGIDSTKGIIVQNDGKVGIGTSTPGEALEVNGHILAEGLYINNDGTGSQSPSGNHSTAYIQRISSAPANAELEIGSDNRVLFTETDGDNIKANFELNNGYFGFGSDFTPTHVIEAVASGPNEMVYAKTTDGGPTYMTTDTTGADGDTHSAFLFREDGTIRGGVGWNAAESTVSLTNATGINSTNGIRINSDGTVLLHNHITGERIIEFGGTGSTIRRITDQNGLVFGCDSSLVLHAGDHVNSDWDSILNIPDTDQQENIHLAADSGVRITTNLQNSTTSTPHILTGSQHFAFTSNGVFTINNQDASNHHQTNPSIDGNGALPAIWIKSKYEGDPTTDGENGGGIRFVDNNTNNYIDQAFINNNIVFSHKDSGGTDRIAIINDNTTGTPNTVFTGQHKNLPSAGEISDYNNKVGYIVVSTGVYYNINKGVEKAIPTINESLPKVTLSTQVNDKRVFGVISDAEDPDETRTERVGCLTYFPFREDDRLIINSLGEGAIMVSNINGNLENGDYITTSAIEGLGMKQDDDLLHNYTVAKITQDCNFSSDTTDVTHDGQTYKMKLVGCTYHCG